MPLVLTTNQTQEVSLKPALKSKLLRELKAYAALRTDLKAIEAALDKHKGVIRGLREEAGVESLSIEGFKTSNVTSLRSSLDKQRLLAMGLTMEMLDEATITKPGKPYERVTCPGEKSYGEGE